MLCLPFPAHSAHKCPFGGIFSATCFAFLCFFLVILLPKMTPKNSGAVMSSVPKCEKTAMSFLKKIYMLDKLHSCMSQDAVGFKVNGNYVYTYIYVCVCVCVCVYVYIYI